MTSTKQAKKPSTKYQLTQQSTSTSLKPKKQRKKRFTQDELDAIIVIATLWPYLDCGCDLFAANVHHYHK